MMKKFVNFLILTVNWLFVMPAGVFAGRPVSLTAEYRRYLTALIGFGSILTLTLTIIFNYLILNYFLTKDPRSLKNRGFLTFFIICSSLVGFLPFLVMILPWLSEFQFGCPSPIAFDLSPLLFLPLVLLMVVVIGFFLLKPAVNLGRGKFYLLVIVSSFLALSLPLVIFPLIAWFYTTINPFLGERCTYPHNVQID